MLKSNRMHSLREGRQATDFMMMFIYFGIVLQSQTSAPTIKFIVVSTTKRDDVSQWVKKKKKRQAGTLGAGGSSGLKAEIYDVDIRLH